MTNNTPKYSIAATYEVYWDSECQTEISRFTGPFYNGITAEGEPILTTEYTEWLSFLEFAGGGNYNLYSCLEGYHITKVIPRSSADSSDLQIIMMEDETPNKDNAAAARAEVLRAIEKYSSELYSQPEEDDK